MHHIETCVIFLWVFFQSFLHFFERNVSEKGMQCCIQTVNIVKKL